MANRQNIVIAGAGCVGCYIGGLLAAGGHNVTLLARPRILSEIRAHGLSLTDISGRAMRVEADQITLSQNPTCLSGAGIVIVTARSNATSGLAKEIARHAAQDAQILSLQDGVGNASILTAALAGYVTRAGMVPFGIIPLGEGCFHRTAQGDILIGAGGEDLAMSLSVPHLTVRETRDIGALQWGKLLLRLNDAPNALSGLALQDQLCDRGWRRLLAGLWAESLAVLRAHRIRAAALTAFPNGAVPALLRSPVPMLGTLARALSVPEGAVRSAAAHDLMAGRRTEVDEFQGLIARMGQQAGLKTPVCDMVLDITRCAEIAGDGLPDLPSAALHRALRA